jgi:hypothetical protein
MKAGKLIVVLGGLICLATAAPINANFVWTGTGTLEGLTDIGGGTDVEMLGNATITLSVEIAPGVYGDLWGTPFAPAVGGGVKISGSGIAANNSTHPFTYPFSWQVPPYGFSPDLFTAVNVHDKSGFFPVANLPSGRILTLAHNAGPPTATGATAAPGSTILIDDFPVGTPLEGFTVAVHPNPTDPVVTQYKTVIPTFEATETSNTTFEVDKGNNVQTGFLGGTNGSEGVNVIFDVVTDPGTVTVDPKATFDPKTIDFLIATSNPPQLWHIDFTGAIEGLVTLILNYDENNLLIPEEDLVVWRFDGSGVGTNLGGAIDTGLNTVTVEVDGFSTFGLGASVAPEPATLALLGLGVAGIGYQRCKRLTA